MYVFQLRFSTALYAGAQRNVMLQSKTPFWMFDAGVIIMPNVSLSMFSITGVCTRRSSPAMRSIIGMSQCSWHSQCASRKTSTSPRAALAPVSRALSFLIKVFRYQQRQETLINPCRSGWRISFTKPLKFASIYLSSSVSSSGRSVKTDLSSTKMISSNRAAGVVSRIEYMVLYSVQLASLWKMMITDALPRLWLGLYCLQPWLSVSERKQWE